MKPNPEAVGAHSNTESRMTFFPYLYGEDGKIKAWIRVPAKLISVGAAVAALSAVTGINFKLIN